MTTDSPSALTRLLEACVFLDDARARLGPDGPADEVAAIRDDVDAVLADLEDTDAVGDERQSARRSYR